MNRILIVIDMQNDFIDGALGTPEAAAILPNVVKKIRNFDGKIFFTMDTHDSGYLESQEGRALPVPHCIKGTPGWMLPPILEQLSKELNAQAFEKPTFGSTALAQHLVDLHKTDPIDSIEIVGLCTDICVISNALLIKANLPEIPISVDSSCCAGVTPAKHEATLETMRSCQIRVTDGQLQG